MKSVRERVYLPIESKQVLLPEVLDWAKGAHIPKAFLCVRSIRDLRKWWHVRRPRATSQPRKCSLYYLLFGVKLWPLHVDVQQSWMKQAPIANVCCPACRVCAHFRWPHMRAWVSFREAEFCVRNFFRGREVGQSAAAASLITSTVVRRFIPNYFAPKEAFSFPNLNSQTVSRPRKICQKQLCGGVQECARARQVNLSRRSRTGTAEANKLSWKRLYSYSRMR